MKRLLLICTPFFFYACSVGRKAQYSDTLFNQALADSMLIRALDHEALYSLADTIKPISSVCFLSFHVAKDSSRKADDYNVAVHNSALDSIARYQAICRQLSNGKVKFVLIPFAQPEREKRNMEIYAVNLYKFSRTIAAHAAFFGQFGITADTDPSQAITQLEYENKLDRWRGYGYLFGYPSYAVDFFVQAGAQEEQTGAFVKRDFFAIPVFAGNKGHFTYAMPKGHRPGVEDSVLYQSSIRTLERYKVLREKYSGETGVKAMTLWKKVAR